MSLNKPKTIARIHSILPSGEFPNKLKISPKIANGIFNQLSQPNKGIKAKNIPMVDIIPSITAIVFIVYYFYFF